MHRAVLQKLFSFYLLAAVIFATSLPAYAASPQSPEGIFVKICGSGQLIFIPLKGDDRPDPGQPHTTACHAICANEDVDGDEES